MSQNETADHKDTQDSNRHPEDTAAEHRDDAAVQDQAAEADLTGQQDPSDSSAQLEELRKQSDENYQRFLRVQADFENFRRRTRQEKEELSKYASMQLIEKLLPVIDNFDRALLATKGATDNAEAFIKGVEMIFRQIEQMLEQEGLKPMETIGRPFNPEFHQAIMQVESKEYAEGIVVEEVQKGYMLKDKVLRPAMVKVSS
ncbi:nucleotide exchange factor GrpE [Ferviditalea candida]|uniref:Protein GrpE n=1 Tax=Ferviditalea candida TaxID=3108399 RepID=A0ABU5ZES1_9BACL|nr:nucleotide exchange factor GrpE [Paenibacillaceae bacterium T2]